MDLQANAQADGRENVQMAALWVETARNLHIQFIDINLFPMSFGVSERASEQMSAAEGERSEQCGVICDLDR